MRRTLPLFAQPSLVVPMHHSSEAFSLSLSQIFPLLRHSFHALFVNHLDRRPDEGRRRTANQRYALLDCAVDRTDGRTETEARVSSAAAAASHAARLPPAADVLRSLC